MRKLICTMSPEGGSHNTEIIPLSFAIVQRLLPQTKTVNCLSMVTGGLTSHAIGVQRFLGTASIADEDATTKTVQYTNNNHIKLRACSPLMPY